MAIRTAGRGSCVDGHDELGQGGLGQERLHELRQPGAAAIGRRDDGDHRWRTVLPLRVLFVNHTGEVSGAEIALLRLLGALPEEVQCAVAAPPTGPLAEALAERGVSHLPIPGTGLSFRLNVHTTPRALWDTLRSLVALRLQVRRFRPDVIHANGTRAGLLAAHATGHRGPALVVQVHDILPPSTMGRSVRRILARSADRVIGVSNATTDAFNDGLSPPAAVTQYISIDHRLFCAHAPDRGRVRRELGIAQDAPLLGHVAQITPWKGQIVAIEALASVRRRHPDAQLVIVGSVAFVGAGVRYDNAAYERQLRARVAELGLERAVHFAGHRRDIPAVMRDLDLLLLPSWEEPFGAVMVEAMASQTPVLVTDRGGPPEVVQDGVTGRVLPPLDPDRWADAICDLLGDPGLRGSMGLRAAEAAARFTDAAYARGCMETYGAAQRARTASPT